MSDTHTSVAVIELEQSGHRLHFATLLANHLAQEGLDCVLVTSPESLESREGRENFSYLDKRVQVETWLRSSGIKSCTEHYASDDRWVIVLDGEGLLYRRSLPRANSRRVICLMLHSPSLYPVHPAYSRPLKRALVTRAEKSGFRILNLASPSIVLSDRPNTTADPSPFALLPPLHPDHGRDPLDPNFFWIGLFGGLSQRKGVKLLVEAIKESRRSDLALLIVGQWEAAGLKREVVHLSEKAGIAIEINDQFVTTQELRSQVARVDQVAVLNNNEGSSGILLASCDLRKPAILSGSVSLHREAHALGVPWIAPTPLAIAQYFRGIRKEGLLVPKYQALSDGRDFTEPFMNVIRAT